MSHCHITALEHDHLMLAIKGPVVLLPPTSRSRLGFLFDTGGRSPRSLFLLHLSHPFPFRILDVLQEWPQLIVAARLNFQKIMHFDSCSAYHLELETSPQSRMIIHNLYIFDLSWNVHACACYICPSHCPLVARLKASAHLRWRKAGESRANEPWKGNVGRLTCKFDFQYFFPASTAKSLNSKLCTNSELASLLFSFGRLCHQWCM